MPQGRRPPPAVPFLGRLDLREGLRQLSILWQWVIHDFTALPMEHGPTHSVGGSDPLDTPGTPSAVEAGVTASAGSGPAYALEDHVHSATTGAPAALGEALAEGAGAALARASHVHPLAVRVAKAGVTVGTRKRINLIEGSNVTLTVSDDAGSDEVDVTVTAATAAPTGAQYVVVALDGTLAAERRLQGTANQVSLADGGANGDLVLSTPQNTHTAATPQFARMGLGVAADGTIILLLHNETNDNLPYEVLAIRRKRADSTAPGAADFGADIAWRLEGNTNDSDVVAAKIRGAWDKAQTNDTTDRDAYLAFSTMQGTGTPTLLERVRIDANGSVCVAMQGALATTATDGFLYIPTCAGQPTGAPTAYAGQAPIVLDTTNRILYAYFGGAWVAL